MKGRLVKPLIVSRSSYSGFGNVRLVISFGHLWTSIRNKFRRFGRKKEIRNGQILPVVTL
jgi:hypothetical protein